MITCNTKHILELQRLFIGLPHGIRRLLLQTIDGTNARHDSIQHVHQHTRSKQKGTNTEHRHNPHKMHQHIMKRTILRRTHEIIPPKQRQRIRRTRPRINQKQEKVFEIASSHAIIHPRTMMIHLTNTAIADATMMRHGGFIRLTLTTHGMRFRRNHALALHWNGGARHRARIRQTGLRMTRQCHDYQHAINHTQHGRDTIRRRQQCHSHHRIQHEKPNQTRHNRTRLIGAVHPYAIIFDIGTKGTCPRMGLTRSAKCVNVIFTPFGHDDDWHRCVQV
mmetsp:Transcript_12060/g.18185  ORF Transcript_12060/g.18185 Transcript_12060/m.18185 type:complete len:278 (+) Transcript_12060:319-1152(+)